MPPRNEQRSTDADLRQRVLALEGELDELSQLCRRWAQWEPALSRVLSHIDGNGEPSANVRFALLEKSDESQDEKIKELSRQLAEAIQDSSRANRRMLWWVIGMLLTALLAVAASMAPNN